MFFNDTCSVSLGGSQKVCLPMALPWWVHLRVCLPRLTYRMKEKLQGAKESQIRAKEAQLCSKKPGAKEAQKQRNSKAKKPEK